MNSPDIFHNKIIVDELLKSSSLNKTEKIYVSMSDGRRRGPFIRKTFVENTGLAQAYDVIAKKQHSDISNHLIKLYSVVRSDKNIQIFEEYFDGVPLPEFLKTYTFDNELLACIFTQICDAVNCLHTAFDTKIIHRDIKPENILVAKNGANAKLIDLGIARNYDESESSDTRKFGTVGYAAPEQFGFAQTDERSDVYALGKLLEFLCDANNWKSQNAEAKASQFADIIAKACQFDPILRYKNVEVLLHDFNAVKNRSTNKFALVLGHIWNILLAATVIFFTFVVFATINDSGNVNYQMSLGQKIIYPIMMIVFLFLGSFAALSYKPSLRQIFKQLPRFGIKHYIILVLICIAGITISAFFAQLF